MISVKSRAGIFLLASLFFFHCTPVETDFTGNFSDSPNGDIRFKISNQSGSYYLEQKSSTGEWRPKDKLEVLSEDRLLKIFGEDNLSNVHMGLFYEGKETILGRAANVYFFHTQKDENTSHLKTGYWTRSHWGGTTSRKALYKIEE